MAYFDNINPSQLLNAMGLRQYKTRSTFSDTAYPVALFSAGILLGAGLALVLAPKSGVELRADLSRQAKQLGTAVRERMPNLPIGQREVIGQRDSQVGVGWDDPASVS
jgi:hypothetical protein